MSLPLSFWDLQYDLQLQCNQHSILLCLQDILVQLNEQARSELAAEMDKLRGKKAEMGKKFQKLQAASGEAYEDLKVGMDRAMAEMDKAYEQAMSRFAK